MPSSKLKLLPVTTTVRQLQEYVEQLNEERKFSDDVSKKLIMLMEEVGELAKAVRKQVGMKFSKNTEQKDTAEELADIQIVLLGMASLLDVDMITAVEEKERKNRSRTWK